MTRRAGETGAGGGDAGKVPARAADAAPAGPVRVPKEFRFDVDRGIVRREGRHVVLSRPFEDWEDYWENGARFTDDFYEAMEELDKDDLPLEEREPFD